MNDFMNKLLLCAILICLGPLLAKADVDLTKPLDLKFTAVDGTPVDLSKMRGKVVLIDFWATWCPPCRTVSPDILMAYKKYHKQGFEVIGISVDSSKEDLLKYVKKEGLVWPQYFDDKGPDNEISSKFGVDSFPTLWLVDKKGMVVDANFRENWAVNGGIPTTTSIATHTKIDTKLEALLKAP